MFEKFFEKIVDTAKQVNSVETARTVINDSGLPTLFSQMRDTRGEGKEKFASADAVPGDVRDIARLISLGEAIKPIVALEIGSGYSTAALAHVIAASEISLKLFDIPDRNERSFVVESLDESADYIKITKDRLPLALKNRVRFHHSCVSLTMVHNRYATLFEKLPNCLPDLIYLDGPSQNSATETLRGFSVQGSFRMPMAADILLIEHFLEPGCVILIDGRTANARFLKANFQRSWLYHHDPVGDFHIMIMNEPPLGSVNLRKLNARGML